MNEMLIFTALWTFFVAFILFSITVIMHEVGHFLAARRKGLVIERFAIGFGPKMIGWKYNDVEYVINWLPFGGFVQLPQMADMEMVEGDSSLDVAKLPPVSPWAKIVTAFWGPLFSFLFAVFLSVIVWQVGVPQNSIMLTTTIGFIEPGSPAAQAGLKPGDRILSVDGQPVTRWSGRAGGIVESILLSLNQTIHFDIERSGKILSFEVNPMTDPEMEGMRIVGFENYMAQDLVVGEIFPDSPAAQAGLRKGDRVVSLDDHLMYVPVQVFSYVQDSTAPIKITYFRNKQSQTVILKPGVATNHKGKLLGIAWDMNPVTLVKISPVEQITNSLAFIFKTLRAVGSPHSNVQVRHLSGPIGIFDRLMTLLTTDPRLVLYFTVILNVNLAVVNLLPIPILDGGHIVLSFLEMIRGRTLSPRWMYNIQMGFFVILATFFLFVTYYDVWRVGKHWRGMMNKPVPIEAPRFTPSN